MRLAAPSPTLAEHARYPWFVLGTVCLGTFMGSIDLSGINATFPILASAFDTTVAVIGWVTLAHMITSTTCMTISGRLADLVGRKRIYLAGLLVVLGGSLLTATAQSLGWLIAARVVTGLGASMTVANSVALIGATFPANRRGTAIGTMETTVAIGLAIGPILGGLLTDWLGWRVIAPAGMGVAAVGSLLLTRLDPAVGLAATFPALVILIFGLGSFISPNDSAIVGAAPRDKLGVAGGILAMTRSLGMIVGIALAGTILGARQPVYLAGGLDETAAFVEAFHDVFRFTTAACILAALASLVGGGRRR